MCRMFINPLFFFIDGEEKWMFLLHKILARAIASVITSSITLKIEVNFASKKNQ